MTLAIIDATIDASGPALCTARTSRYATPIANSSLIARVLDELARCGVTRARVVTDPQVRPELEHIFRTEGSSGVEISYVEAGHEDGRLSLLTELQQVLSEDAVLLHPGDCLFGAQMAAMWERFRIGDVDAVLPEQASVDVLRAGDDARVSDSALVLGAGIRPLLAELRPPAGGGENLIHTLLHSDCRLAVCEAAEHWCYSGSTEALLSANRMILDRLPATEPGSTDGNRLHGRISISASAHVSNCLVYGPVSIGDRAVLEDCSIGPYTAVGADAILSGAEVDNSMVLAGAEVRSPGFRIEGSIIGERAHVARSFELPKGLHMRLGPGSRALFS